MTNGEREEFQSLLGEGLHTGLRKGSDAEDAHVLWNAIADSETSAWSDAVRFCADGLLDAYTITPKQPS
jgi:adenine deaminase